VEGWALYGLTAGGRGETLLADLDRLGMLSGQAFVPHGWAWTRAPHDGMTRQQAIDYMLAHTAKPRGCRSEVDATSSIPARPAYMLGLLEIRKAREARSRPWAKFDIKAFHDRARRRRSR